MEAPNNIPHPNEHNLLMELNKFDSKKTDKKSIKDLVNSKLGYLKYFTPTHTKIYNSANILLQDVKDLKELPHALTEIAGAINGLNILHKSEDRKEVQATIGGEIEEAIKMEQSIKNIIQIKEAIFTLPKEYHNLHNNQELFKDFDTFRSLYGSTRNINPSFIPIYIMLWNNKTTHKSLNNFITVAIETRKKNLNLLDKGKIPKFEQMAMEVRRKNFKSSDVPRYEDDIDGHNDKLRKAHAELLENCMLFLADFDDKKSQKSHLFKNTFDVIFNTRCILTNAQINTDEYSLAFNSQDTGVLSKRSINARFPEKREILRILSQKRSLGLKLDEREKNVEKTIRSELKEYEKDRSKLKEYEKDQELELEEDESKLEESESKISSTDNTIDKKRLELLMDGYLSREGMYYYLMKWDPMIGPNDPIKPLNRILGFALLEGRRNESVIMLDFASILGEKNLGLNLAERELLSKFLIECDTAFGYDPSVRFYWKEHLPETIQDVLNKFENENCPHLKSLSTDQKDALILAAFKFAEETTLNLNRNLLNLI